ncbi:MAG: hypothetical protein KJ621_11655 [Proteobacteria bacterium]|nr:hypothetical protein [Pseudomonadota bacterium]
MIGPAKRIAFWTTALAVVLFVPLGCGPSGDDAGELQGVWINTSVLKGRPIVVRFQGRRVRLTIGAFFKLDLKLTRVKMTGNTFTLNLKDQDGRKADYTVVKTGPDNLRTVVDGRRYVFRRLTGAEAEKYKLP